MSSRYHCNDEERQSNASDEMMHFLDSRISFYEETTTQFLDFRFSYDFKTPVCHEIKHTVSPIPYVLASRYNWCTHCHCLPPLPRDRSLIISACKRTRSKLAEHVTALQGPQHWYIGTLKHCSLGELCAAEHPIVGSLAPIRSMWCDIRRQERCIR